MAEGPRAVAPPTGQPLLELIRVMDRLRSPGGCPWDAEQTHESLVQYLTEEAYEAVEAIESGDRDAMLEELGDVLLQVMFHSRIAQEHPTAPWSVDDVASGIAAKLVARHPHVFGDETAESAAHVESVWLARKTAEKARESMLDGIPVGLPSLLLAGKLLDRTRHGGVAVPATDPQVARVAAHAVAEVGPDRLGDLLLALVVAGRAARVQADVALRATLRDFEERVRAAEGGSRRAPADRDDPDAAR